MALIWLPVARLINVIIVNVMGELLDQAEHRSFKTRRAIPGQWAPPAARSMGLLPGVREGDRCPGGSSASV